MREFIIQLQDVDEDGRDYDLAVSVGWLQQALQEANLTPDPDGGEGRLSLHVQRNGQDVLVQGRVQARLTTECGRCLGPVVIDVDTPLTVLFTARPASSGREPADQDLTPDDLEQEYFSGSQIVLDDVVRDHLVLEIPMQPACPSGCAEQLQVPEGIKPPAEVFDKQRSGVDPRLAALKDLAAKLPRDKE